MNQERIGKFLSKLRKNKKITQEELAEKLHISSKSISRWETGKCMPDISLLIPLSEILEVEFIDSVIISKNGWYCIKGKQGETYEEDDI